MAEQEASAAAAEQEASAAAEQEASAAAENQPRFKYMRHACDCGGKTFFLVLRAHSGNMQCLQCTSCERFIHFDVH